MMFFSLEKILGNRKVQEDIGRYIKKGYVFVYPTDTVYGLGCDATKPEAVGRIRTIKETDHPFSVIAPSREWIEENFIILHPQQLDTLPGPYTLILRKKSVNFLESVCSSNSLGVRIPAHPMTKIIQESEKPFVTTSANKSGHPTQTSVSSVPKDILRQVDIVIDGGVLGSQASTIIDISGPEVRVIRR